MKDNLDYIADETLANEVRWEAISGGRIEIERRHQRGLGSDKTGLKHNRMAETRYSDNDLQEFQALIEEKLAVARENYDELQRALSHSDDNTTDDTAPTLK